MPASSHSLRSLLAADYARLYEGRSGSGVKGVLRAAMRFLTNPSLHAVVMIRAALAGPPTLIGVWRQALLAKHSIDLERGCVMGPGLMLPHPFGILLAAEAEIGANVTIYHNVTVGAVGENPRTGPTIGDRVVVHTNTVLAPGAVVGEGATIGANSFVEGEVPRDAVFVRGRVAGQMS